MKVVIMAGGLGKRIADVDPTIPKPLLPISGKPILQWEIECLVRQGLNEIIITVSHMAEKIQDYFGDGTKFGCNIEYYVEKQPLGNAGALFRLWEERKLDGDFLLLNADSMFDVDFKRFIAFHEKKRDKEQGNKGQDNKGQHDALALATLFTHPNNHPYDSTLIVANPETHVIEQWLTKDDERPAFYKNCVNAGLHILNTELLELSGIDPASIDSAHKIDLDRDVLKPAVARGRIYSYNSPEYVKDMGTPERFQQVCEDLESGKVHARNLSQKQKAIFLDRDGTINKSVGFLKNVDDFELLPGVAEAIRRINDSDYLVIVVTNQPVIARGEVTVEGLQKIHNKMETLLGEQEAYIDGLYYCPHHPDKGFEGEVPELKIDCECRKPKTGMFLKAVEDFHIDTENSWMVGDSENDILAGKNVGCNTAWIVNTPIEDLKAISDEEGNLIEPTAYVDNLLCAVKFIDILDRLNERTVDPQAKYVLFNKRIGMALWTFKPNPDGSRSPNGEMFVGDLPTAVTLLIHQQDFDDFELMTTEQYFRVNDILAERRTKWAEEIAAHAVEVSLAQMKYEDFILIGMYPGLTGKIVSFVTYLEWLMKNDFKALSEKLMGELNLSYPPKRSSEAVIEGIITTSEKEFQKKASNSNYYICSYVAIMYIVKNIFTEKVLETLKVADKDGKTRFIVENYQNILTELLWNIEDLCSLYSENLGDHQKQSTIRAIYIPTSDIHQALRQSIYGNVSLHASQDRKTSASIGTIRQMVELRIRRAFGVLAFVDTEGKFAPLDMTMLFEAIGHHKNEIKLPIKLENIIRIYRWANVFVHSGVGDYPWIPIYLEFMLRDFSFGKMKKDGSWSIHNGIKVKQTTIEAIHRELLEKKNGTQCRKGLCGWFKKLLKKRSNVYALHKCTPECEILP